MLRPPAIKAIFPQSHIILHLYVYTEREWVGVFFPPCVPQSLPLFSLAFPFPHRTCLVLKLDPTVPETNVVFHFLCVKWTNMRTSVPHNKLIREEKVPMQQHKNTDICVCSPRRRMRHPLIFSSQKYIDLKIRCIYLSSGCNSFRSWCFIKRNE